MALLRVKYNVQSCMKLLRSSRFPEKRVGGLILSSFVSLELDGAIGNRRASVGAAGLAASRLTQLQLELAKTKIFEQPKPIAVDSQLQSTIVNCKPLPSYRIECVCITLLYQ